MIEQRRTGAALLRAHRVLACFMSVVMMTAVGCGSDGGSGSGSAQAPGANNAPARPAMTVGSATVDKLSYRQPVLVSVEGSALDQGLSAKASGACTSIDTVQSSATKLQLTCTPAKVGALQLQLLDTSGAEIGNYTWQVPLPQVKITIANYGDLLVELDPSKAPVTVDNFLQYVKDGFYANTKIHRIARSFVVQAGSFDATSGQAKPPRAPIELEPPAKTGLHNSANTIAMARSTDPNDPLGPASLNSASSQFFINTVDNAELDTVRGGYAVFGKLVAGESIITTLDALPVDIHEVPKTDVVITGATQTQ